MRSRRMGVLALGRICAGTVGALPWWCWDGVGVDDPCDGGGVDGLHGLPREKNLSRFCPKVL